MAQILKFASPIPAPSPPPPVFWASRQGYPLATLPSSRPSSWPCGIALPDAPAPSRGSHPRRSLLIIFEVKRPNRTSWVFRNWYPLLYVASCYKEMALLDSRGLAFRCRPMARRSRLPLLAGASHGVARAHSLSGPHRVPAGGLHAVHPRRDAGCGDPLAPAPLSPSSSIMASLIALGFLVSYIGYLAVPARGPRFLLRSEQHIPLAGLWLFEHMQNALDRLESAHYDCFPSGHTELTMLAWWGSRMIRSPCFGSISSTLCCIIFATVYLRYHYSVDVLAGDRRRCRLIVSAPVCYRKLSKGEEHLEGVEVVAVNDRRALQEFIEFPYGLYIIDPFWVPPLRIAVKDLLDRKKHPFYANADAEFFVARWTARWSAASRRSSTARTTVPPG